MSALSIRIMSRFLFNDRESENFALEDMLL